MDEFELTAPPEPKPKAERRKPAPSDLKATYGPRVATLTGPLSEIQSLLRCAITDAERENMRANDPETPRAIYAACTAYESLKWSLDDADEMHYRKEM